jgi:hypothetical protein
MELCVNAILRTRDRVLLSMSMPEIEIIDRALGEVGLGLGGPSAGVGPVTMFECVHAIGCVSVALQAKGFRPAWLSSWNKGWLPGGELSFGYYFLKATLAAFRPTLGSGDLLVSVGGGVQLFY